jgi:hypothetical protein
MYPVFFVIWNNFTPNKMIQNGMESGTNSCSHMLDHPRANPRPGTPRSDMPEQTEANIRRVNTQNPNDLPATM